MSLVFSFQLYFVSIIEKAIQDGIGQGRLTYLFAPVFYRQLTGDHHKFQSMPIFEDLWIGECCHGDNKEKVYHQLCRIVDEWLEIYKKTENHYLPQQPIKNIRVSFYFDQAL